jgi:hypothetical protein
MRPFFARRNSAGRTAVRQSKQSRRPPRRRMRFELLEDRRVLDTVTWDGGGDGRSWHDIKNWDRDALPTARDDVVIDSRDNFTVIYSTGNSTILSLTSSELISITGGGLEIDATSRLDGGLNMSGGALTGDGEIIVGGPSSWTGGTMSGSGVTTIGPDAILNLGRGTLQRNLANKGHVRVVDTLTVSSPHRINNLVDATIEFTNNTGLGTFGGEASLDNAGLIIKSGGTGTSNIDAFVDNAGTIQVDSGTINLRGGSRHSGATEGRGVLQLNASFGEPHSTIGEPFWNVDRTRFSSSTLTPGGDEFVVRKQFDFEGGTIAGSNITFAGTLNWTGGTMNLGGRATVAAGATASISSGTLNGLLINEGRINLTGTLSGSNPATIENTTTGSIDLQANIGFGTFGGRARLNNAGLLVKSALTGTSNVDAFVDNTGTIRVDTGTINLRGGSQMGGATDGPGILQLATSFGETHSTVGDPAWNVAHTRFSTNTLTVSGDQLTFPNRFDFEGGTIAGSNITFAGTLNWTGGTLAASGATIAATGIANVSGGTLSGNLTNEGQLNLTGTLSGSLPATITNTATGTFDLKTNVGFGTFGGKARLNNAGVLTKTGGTGTSEFDAFVESAGTIRVDVGTLNLRGGSQIAGETDGSATLQLASSFGETHTIFGNPNWDVARTRFSSSTLTISSSRWFVRNQLDVESGTINGNDLLVRGTLDWFGGTMGGSGITTIERGGVLNLSGGTLTRDLENEGSINITGTMAASNPVRIVNRETGTIDFQNNARFETFQGNSRLDNLGVIVKSGLTGTSNVDAIVTNAGTILADRGTLNFRGGLTQSAGQTVLSGGALAAANFMLQGGELSGAGTFTGNVQNAGIVRPGGVNKIGTLTIAGNYTQPSAGRLEIEIAGPAAGQYDRLAVQSAANLNGELEITTLPGPPLNDGALLNVLTYGSRTNDFATTTGLMLGNGQQLLPTAGVSAYQMLVIGNAAFDAVAVRDALLDALAFISEVLPDWGDLLDLDGFGDNLPTLPFIPTSLSDLFDIGDESGEGGLFDDLVPSSLDPASTSSELIAALQSAGLEVLCLWDGSLGPPACVNDAIVEVRFTHTFADLLATGEIDDAIAEELAELVAGLGWQATTDWHADIEVELIVGIANGESYLRGDSQLVVRVEGDGAIAGSVDLVEILTVDANGTAAADLDVALQLSDEITRHPLNTVNVGSWSPHIDGTADLALTLDVPLLDISGTGAWLIEIDDNTVSTTTNISYTPPAVFPPPGLEELAAELAEEILGGERSSFLAELLAAFGGPSTPGSDSSLGEALDIAQALAEFVVDNTEVLYVADFATIESLLRGGTFSPSTELVRFAFDLGAMPLDVADDLSFELTSVLPFANGTTAAAAIENARLTGFLVFGADASADPFYVLTEPDAIRPDRVTSIGGGLDFVLALDGAPLGPELVIVDEGRAVLSPTIGLTFPGAESGKLRFSDGVGDMSVALDAAVELSVSADDVTIAPNSPVQVRVVDDDPNDGVPRMSGSLNLETGAFSLSARRILADFADVLHVQAELVDVAYDPSGEPTDDLLRVANLVVDLDALTVDGITPTATLSEFGVQQNGTLFVGAATVEIPDGYVNALGLAGLLPLTVDSLTLTFPNPDDLNQFRLDGTGRVLIGTIDQQLDSLLGQDVTPIVYIGDPSEIGGDNITEIAPGDSTPLPFSLNVASLSQGIVSPIDFGPITLGLLGLQVGAATFDAQMTLGGYANGAWNPNIFGFVRMTADDPANPADDQFLDVEVSVLPTSTLTFDATSMTLDINAEATLAAGGTGVVVDGVRALFGLEVETLVSTSEPFVQVTRFEPSFESLAIQQFTFELDNLFRFTANEIEFVTNPPPGQPIASLGDVTVDFLSFPELVAGSLDGVALYDDPGIAGDRRVEIASAEVAISGSIGSPGSRLLDVDNLRLVLSNLVINLDTPAFNADAVRLLADSATLLPDAQSGGVAAVTGFDAFFDAGGNLTVTIDRLDATIANTFVVEALGGQLRFGPSVSAETPLLTVDQVTARIPTLGDVSFIATSVALSRQGDFSLLAASTVSDTGLAATLGIGEFLPLDLTHVEVIFDPPVTPGGPTDFTQFALHVEGEFQFDELDLPFTPIVRVGEQSSADEPTFEFTIDVDFAEGTIRPVDFGPITLGVADFAIGEMVLAGEITLGGYEAGQFVPTIGGFLEVDLDHADSTIKDVGEDPDVGSGSGVSFEGLRLDLAGEFTPAAANNGVTELFVELAANVKVRFKIGELLELYGVNFAVDVTIANDFSQGFAPTITPRLQSIGVDLLRVKIEEVFEFETTGATINITRDEGEPLATLGTVGLSFPQLAGIGGEVLNLDILDFGVPDFSKIEGVELTLDTNGGSLFDTAFQYVPIQVERLGAKFKDGLFHRDDEGRITGIADATQLVLIISGGMSSVSVDGDVVWPFSANVEDLEIDIAKLATGDFPIISVGGFGIGLEPIELVDGFTIGGGIQFGTLDLLLDDRGTPEPDDDDVERVLYGRIFGEFAFEGIGASVELVITEYGPVAAGFAVPLAITLGQTGIMITGVKGTLQFGRTVPSISDPDELAGDEFENPIDLDFNDEETIRSFVEPAVLAGNYTWEQAFTLALAGSISHIAVVGMVSGEVTLAANVGLQDDPATPANEAGLKLLGYGDVNIIGMALAEARLFLDLTDPINPVFAAVFLAPAPSNPLSFLFPAKINIGALLDTKGFALAAAVGTRAFLNDVALGTIEVAAPLFDAALDHMAERLTANPHSELAKFIRPGVDALPSPATPAFTASEITTALLELVPGNLDDLVDALPSVVEVTTAFSSELFPSLSSLLLTAQEELQEDAAAIRQRYGLDPIAAVAGFEASIIIQFSGQNTAIIADIARDALLAFVRVLKEATIDAIHEIAALSGDDTLFDPILIFRGKFTPIMFGIPMGPPLFDVELIVSKQGITFGADVSVNATISKLASLTSVGTFLTFGFPTPITDRTFAQVRLPFADDAPELVAAALVDLVEGRIPVSINPISDDWAIVLRGFIDIFGYQVADLGGMAFPAGATDLLTARIQKVYLDPDAPLNPDQFQITEQQYYDAMLQYGGILLNGGLQTPALISDPLAVLDNLLNLPDPLQNPFGYVDALFNALGEVEEQTKLQMFIPSFLHLLELNFDTFTVEQSGDEPPVGELPVPRVRLRPDVTQAELDELLDAFFIDGVFTPKILGIELADGRLRGDRYGLSITGSIPWLAGLQAQLDLSAVDTVQTGTGAVSVGRLLNVLGPGNNRLAGLDGFDFGDQPLPEVSLDVPFPAIGATISIDTERSELGGLSEWERVLDGLGLKIGKFTVPDVNATAEFRAYSPGYDVDELLEPEPDLLKVYGGLELNGELAIPGLIDQAAFAFAMTPPADGQTLPDFTASASVDGLAIPQLNWSSGGTPLVALDDFDLAIERSAAGLTLGLDGDLSLLGFAMSVDGALTITDAGVFGSIPVSFNGNLGAGRGFSLTGNVALEVNTTGTQQGTIPAGGRIVVDGLLTVGQFALDGTFAIRVSGNGLSVLADATLGLGPMGSIDADGYLQITNAGIAAMFQLDGGVASSFSGTSFTLDGNVAFQINTTPLVVAVQFPGQSILFIPAGPYVRASITNATLNLFSLPILSTDGATFTITADASGFDLNVGGSFTFLGNSLNVTSGHLNIEQAGTSRRLTGNLMLSRPGGTFAIGGFNVGVGTSTLGLSATNTVAEVSLAGSISIPGVPFALLGVSGSLATNGTGSLRVNNAGVELNSYGIGPSGSALTASGAFSLTRTASGTTYFGADNVKLRWSGFNTFNSNLEFNIDEFRVGSDGFAFLDVDAIDFRIGTSNFTNQDYMKLFVDDLHLLINPTEGVYELAFDAELEAPGVFTGSNRLNLPTFKVSTSSEFSYDLGNFDVHLGAFRVYNAKLLFQRQDGAFRLSVERRTPSSPVRFEIPGPNNDVDMNSFYVDTQGEFEVDLVMNQLGNSNLNVSGSRFYVRKTGRNLTTFNFRVDAGVLNLPIGQSIALPQISIDSDAIWNMPSFAPPLEELTWGPAFRGRTDSTRNFRFGFDEGLMFFEQVSSGVNLFSLPGSASIQMQNFYADSGGAFNGTVTGQLGIDDYRLASATFNVSRQNGKLRLTLPANSAAAVNLGFVTANVSGFLEMDGNFSFVGTADATITAKVGSLNLARFVGDATVTIADEGFSASGSGNFQVPNGFGGWTTLLSGTGTITKGGCLGFNSTTYCGHRVSINNVSATEGNSGSKQVSFTVTLTQSSQVPLTYPISIPVSLEAVTATAGSTGSSGVDFQSTPTTGLIVNFTSGTSKTVKVRIYGDTTYEQNEHAFVHLGPSNQVAFEDRRGLLTIQNDDADTASGTVSDGYIDGATVFLDANRNGVLDYLDVNGNGAPDAGEPDEPSAISGADGSFAIAVLPAFDLNGNGRYEANEGTIVATGGIDTSTLLPLAYPLTAPAGSTAVTPLTTLLVGLTEDYGLTLVEAESRLHAAFGLPAVRITETDAIADALESSTVGAAVFAAAAQVHDTIMQTANLLAATGGSSVVDAARAALDAIAAMLEEADAGVSIGLADETAIASVVSRAATTRNVSLDPTLVLAAATVIATTNQAIAEIAVAGSSDFLAEVVRVQHVAQTTVAADLAQLGAGTLAPQEAIDRNTSAAIASQTATAPVANIAPPQITIDAPQLSEGSSDSQMMFAVRLSAASAVPVTVSYTTVDGTATVANGDYVVSAGIVEFAPGEVEQFVSVAVRGDMAVELDEYFLVELSYPVGGVITSAVGVGTIADDDTLDGTPPESAVLPLDLLQCSPTFEVAVLAVDEFEESAAGNSGVASVDVYVSANGGPFEFWMTLPEGVSIATFAPQPNTEYAFHSIARDRAGNIEPGPHQASATTRMSIVTPGDANCDGVVNRVDAAILALEFGRASDADWKRGDFNGDRRVDLHDLAILQQAQSARLPGDANLDGFVNRRDLAVVAKNLGRFNGAAWTDGDFNADGRVGLAVLAILQANVTLESANPPAPLAAVATRRLPVQTSVYARPRVVSIPATRSQQIDAVDHSIVESTEGARLRASRQRDVRDQDGRLRTTRS